MRRFAPLLFLAMLMLPLLAHAQSLTLDMGGGGASVTNRVVQLIALTTILSLAPSILLMVTSFTRIIIVFSFIRTAIGLQQSPPNVVLTSLAMFLTLFIMQPTLQTAWEQGIRPYTQEQINETEAFDKTVAPFRDFMLRNTREGELAFFMDLGKEQVTEPAATPLKVLIPAFMISELKRAFEIGFLIFVPFLVIDMVVSSILLAMGMMMLPPATVALPFKIIFFVLLDGWRLICGSLIQSFH